MARKPRVEVPGGVHHVYARGNGKQWIYLSDRDRRLYLRLLAEVVVRHKWRCLSYCLMDNHVHLLLETPEPNLGAGMGRLQGMYAQTFNRRHGHSGHVFQGRFGSVVINTDEQLWTVARYIVRNPVEAGLCERPHDWTWSSHAAVTSGAGPAWLDSQRLLAYFGALGGVPRERYDAFVR
jgi:REP-associated tyrosine transposase